MSTLKVNTIRHTGASSDAVTLASDGSCTANLTNPKSFRNLIINGSQLIAQRGTSSTSSDYQTVDRMVASSSGGSFTQTQSTLTSSDTGPWEKGFRKSYKLTNTGNTTAASKYKQISTRLEGQDICNSGWIHTSASSYITFSFWAKSSFAGTYYVWFRSSDGTNKTYIHPFTLVANTWKKIALTTPGASNVTINDDNGVGLKINIAVDWGTDFTDSGTGTGAWATFVGASRLPDFAQAWSNESNSTFEVTGLQLEVGDTATDFEHRSYADELARCQRYYYKHIEGNNLVVCLGFSSATDQVSGYIQFPTTMRATPSIDHTNGDNYYRLGAGNLGGDKYVDGAWALQGATDKSTRIYATPQSTLTAGEPGLVDTTNASASMAFSAEI